MSAAGQFQNLVLEDVEGTSKELGRGSYGVVIEVIVSGTKCAAKKIHSILIENDDKVSSIGTLYCLLFINPDQNCVYMHYWSNN